MFKEFESIAEEAKLQAVRERVQERVLERAAEAAEQGEFEADRWDQQDQQV